MPFVKLHYHPPRRGEGHLVWAFKSRARLLTPELEARLFPYLVAKAHLLGCQVLAVNGCEDHVHLVVSAPPTLAVSGLVKGLKGASAHALGVHWQVGYGAFTVGERGLPVAVGYVENQKNHHARKTTFAALERWEDPADPPHAAREEAGEYRVDGEGFE